MTALGISLIGRGAAANDGAGDPARTGALKLNKNTRLLEALAKGVVISATTAAQPDEPSVGDLYIIPSGATGEDWGAFTENALALYAEGDGAEEWFEIAPQAGWRTWVADTNTTLIFDEGAWTEFGGKIKVTADGSDTARTLEDRFAERINVLDFGPVGDGDSDNAEQDTEAFLAAAEAAMDAGVALWIPDGVKLVIEEQLTVLNQSLTIIGGVGATIYQYLNDEVIDFTSDFTNVQTVAAIDNANSVDLSGGVTGNSTVARLTVEDASAYAVDDVLKIFSNDEIAGGGEDDATKCWEGETFRVAKIDTGNNYVYAYAPLRFGANYVTSPRVAKMGTHKFVIEGVRFAAHPDMDESWFPDMIKVLAAREPEFRRVRFVNGRGAAIRMRGCREPTVIGAAFEHLATSTSNYGYGVAFYSSEGGIFRDLQAFRVRHAWTDFAGQAMVDNLTTHGIASRGRPKYANISDCQAFWCHRAAWDTHPGGFEHTFINCVARAPHVGHGGARQNFGNRGIGHQFINCRSYGGSGFLTTAQVNTTVSPAQSLFDGCEHTFDPNDVQSNAGFKTIGPSNAGRSPRILYRNPIVRGNGARAIPFHFDRAEVEIIEPAVYQNPSSAGECYVVDAQANSHVRVRGGFVDYEGATTSTLRTFRTDEAGAHIIVDDFEVRTKGATWAALADGDHVAGTIEIYGLKADARPTATIVDGDSTVFKFGTRPQVRGIYGERAQNWANACLVKPPPALMRLVDQLDYELETQNLWDVITYLSLFCVHTEQAALLNMKDGSGIWTNSNCTFTAFTGFTGVPGSNGQLAGPLWNSLAQDDHHIGGRITGGTDAASNTAYLLGQSGGTAQNSLRPRITSDFFRYNVGSTTAVDDANSSILHHFIATRRGASDVEAYIDGSSSGTDSNASTGMTTTGIRVFRNTSSYSDFVSPFVHFGTGLSDAQALAIYTALDDFYQAVLAL